MTIETSMISFFVLDLHQEFPGVDMSQYRYVIELSEQ